MSHQNTAHPGRRVVELECRSADGHPILVAVDSQNRARIWAVLTSMAHLESTKAALMYGLDLLDPADKAQLRII